MKKRISRVLNFFAFNLLFFALYLNFVHKDSNTPINPASKTAATNVKGNVVVSTSEQFLTKALVKTELAAQLPN